MRQTLWGVGCSKWAGTEGVALGRIACGSEEREGVVDARGEAGSGAHEVAPSYPPT